MATVAKKTAARRAAAAPEPERPTPMIRMKRTRTVEHDPDDRVLLFAKEFDDGEVEEFWVPRRRMASLALKYMRMARDDGDNVAMSWLLEKVLGKEAYEDLMEDEQLDHEELIQIFAIVQEAVLGATEDPKEGRR